MNETIRKLESAGFQAEEKGKAIVVVRHDGLEIYIMHDGLEILDRAWFKDNRHVSEKTGIWKHSDTIITMHELKAVLEVMLSIKGEKRH